jgi:hypothetical protein
MKVRKLLPLAILAVIAVVSLSSCDALLDALFSKNQITVDVQVPTYSTPFNEDAFNGYGASITATLTDSSGKQISGTTYNYSSYDNSYIHYLVTFSNQPDGTYYVDSTYYSYYWGYTYTAGTTSITATAGSGGGSGNSVTVSSYP